LHTIWKTLSSELARLQIIDLAPLIDRQRLAVSALAGELGKSIELVIEVGTTRLEPRVAEAVDVAMVHLIRNAVDHGIERAGRISVRAEEITGFVHLVVEDNGVGVDLDAVRERVGAGTEQQLLDALFQPGFTTRSKVSDVSGRGVGLDAVRAGLAKVGGRVSIRTKRGAGTTFTLVVPAPTRQLRVFQFLSPGGSLNLAVSARWSPTMEPSTADAIDPFRVMELSAHSRQTMTNIQMPRPEQLAVRLRWGLLEIPIKVATEPVLATAERVCPTPDDHPLEVISIDGAEALLLRPEHMATLKR
jgi:two-component sensor histidine kinase